MSTRPITSADAAAAAEVVRVVRERPNDRIDPFPPAHEMEVLVDAGARGKGPDRHPIVGVEDDQVVACGALDCSPDMKTAALVGPVVHPAHRRRGHGGRVLQDMLQQARTADQKSVTALIGGENGAAAAMLARADFTRKKTYTCLRISKPAHFPELEMENVTIRRVGYDGSEEVVEFTKKLVPRRPKQVRSLLKTDDYAVLLAYRKDKLVAFAELDMRFGEVATVEQVDGVASALQKGLGNLLLGRLMPIAFAHARIQQFELLAEGTDRRQLEVYEKAGFKVAGEMHGYESKV